MSCSTTTGLFEMRHADSDSVNLGSNPSPPATQITEQFGFSGIGHCGQVGLSGLFGRTEPGTPASEVYFITDGDLIKIGFSGVPKLRMRDLQRANGRPLSLIGTVTAHPYDERIIHKRFEHLRVTGEWFRPDDELRAFIEAVRRRKPIPRLGPRLDDTPDAELARHIKATHSELDAIEQRHGDRVEIASRIRIARHQLRRLAGGERTPELMRAMAVTVADLATVTPTVSARVEV
jgi:hypothetical protein